VSPSDGDIHKVDPQGLDVQIPHNFRAPQGASHGRVAHSRAHFDMCSSRAATSKNVEGVGMRGSSRIRHTSGSSEHAACVRFSGWSSTNQRSEFTLPTRHHTGGCCSLMRPDSQLNLSPATIAGLSCLKRLLQIDS
jgi:hypothetical protein